MQLVFPGWALRVYILSYNISLPQLAFSIVLKHHVGILSFSFQLSGILFGYPIVLCHDFYHHSISVCKKKPNCDGNVQGNSEPQFVKM